VHSVHQHSWQLAVSEESWPKIQDDIIRCLWFGLSALKPHIAKLKETP
jgi:hypothetical protein